MKYRADKSWYPTWSTTQMASKVNTLIGSTMMIGRKRWSSPTSLLLKWIERTHWNRYGTMRTLCSPSKSLCSKNRWHLYQPATRICLRLLKECLSTTFECPCKIISMSFRRMITTKIKWTILKSYGSTWCNHIWKRRRLRHSYKGLSKISLIINGCRLMMSMRMLMACGESECTTL